MKFECVITGCALVRENRWVPGDLFRCDDAFVFNGNVDEKGQPSWQTGDPFYSKTFELTDWFERRGVFAFHVDEVAFNDKSMSYMALEHSED